jgi:lysozyme family protein
MTTDIPNEVNLRGIMHRVTVHEGGVLFSPADPFGPCWTRMMFERKAGCWHVTLGSSDDNAVMVSHVEEAMRYAEQWFGGNHECPRGEYRL